MFIILSLHNELEWKNVNEFTCEPQTENQKNTKLNVK